MSLGYDEARTELQGALDNWDFSPCFPSAYTGLKQVVTVPEWPMDIIQRIQKSNSNGMLTAPIISIMAFRGADELRTLGEQYGSGAVAGTTRYARRVCPFFTVDCWADLQTGGGKMVEALAAQVQACVFVNSHSLATYRYLKSEASHLMFNQAAQLWQFPLTVDGMLLVTYDK